MTILTIILLILAGVFNSICDNITHHWSKSIFNSDIFNRNWWDPSISWKNKYIDLDPSKGRRYWKILGIKIQVNVFFTDAWHMFKMLMLFCLFSAIVTSNYYVPFINTIIDLLIIQMSFVFGFEIFYTKFWRVDSWGEKLLLYINYIIKKIKKDDRK